MTWLALILGFYGAVLSTVLAIRDLWRARPRVKVTCREAIAAHDVGEWHLVAIEAVNSERPVVLRQAGLQLVGGVFVQLASQVGPWPLPRKLDAHEHVVIHFDRPKLEEALQREGELVQWAFVVDAEGRTYKGAPPRTWEGELAVLPSPWRRLWRWLRRGR